MPSASSMVYRSFHRVLAQSLWQASASDFRIHHVAGRTLTTMCAPRYESRITPHVGSPSALMWTPAKACTSCWSFDQVRAFAIRRQRRREEPKAQHIPSLSNLVDWDIDSDKVLVVDQDSKSVMPLAQAVALAHGRRLNVVQVSIQNSQPVCRLLDFKQMQRENRESHERKNAESAEKERRLAKMKGMGDLCSWNIAQHDLEVKIRKIDEFLEKGKLVAVSTTYDHKPQKWQQQYPKAIEVAKSVWSHFQEKVHSWYDYSESGNKQITVMYSNEKAPTTGRHTLLPWEPGSMLPPFLQAAQNEAAQAPGGTTTTKPGHGRSHSKR